MKATMSFHTPTMTSSYQEVIAISTDEATLVMWSKAPQVNKNLLDMLKEVFDQHNC